MPENLDKKHGGLYNTHIRKREKKDENKMKKFPNAPSEWICEKLGLSDERTEYLKKNMNIFVKHLKNYVYIILNLL